MLYDKHPRRQDTAMNFDAKSFYPSLVRLYEEFFRFCRVQEKNVDGARIFP